MFWELRAFWGLYLRKNICLGETFKVTIVTNVYLFQSDVLMDTGGMSHFVNLPSL